MSSVLLQIALVFLLLCEVKVAVGNDNVVDEICGDPLDDLSDRKTLAVLTVLEMGLSTMSGGTRVVLKQKTTFVRLFVAATQAAVIAPHKWRNSRAAWWISRTLSATTFNVMQSSRSTGFITLLGPV